MAAMCFQDAFLDELIQLDKIAASTRTGEVIEALGRGAKRVVRKAAIPFLAGMAAIPAARSVPPVVHALGRGAQAIVSPASEYKRGRAQMAHQMNVERAEDLARRIQPKRPQTPMERLLSTHKFVPKD